MARPNPIRAVMEAPLPGITYQRRKLFRPTEQEVKYAYKIINKYVFNNALRQPEIRVKGIKRCWGMCHWHEQQQDSGSYCHIELVPNWFSPQWFLNILAHEMVHQYQWDVYRWDHIDYFGRNMYTASGAHGPSFYMWRDQFDYYGLNLKITFSQRRWFKHQDFTKC